MVSFVILFQVKIVTDIVRPNNDTFERGGCDSK